MSLKVEILESRVNPSGPPDFAPTLALMNQAAADQVHYFDVQVQGLRAHIAAEQQNLVDTQAWMTGDHSQPPPPPPDTASIDAYWSQEGQQAKIIAVADWQAAWQSLAEYHTAFEDWLGQQGGGQQSPQQQSSQQAAPDYSLAIALDYFHRKDSES